MHSFGRREEQRAEGQLKWYHGTSAPFRSCTRPLSNGMVSGGLIDKIACPRKKRLACLLEQINRRQADLTIWDLDAKYTIDSREFQSMGKSTPFDGYRVYGKCLLTMAGGRMVWKNERAIEDLQPRSCE